MIDLSDITAAIVAALVTLYPATDQVQVGTFTNPPGSVAFAAVEPPSTAASVPFIRSRMHRIDVSYTIRLWAPTVAESLETRTEAAIALAIASRRALTTARRGPGVLSQCAAFLIGETSHGVAAASLPPDWTAATLAISLSYHTHTGG